VPPPVRRSTPVLEVAAVLLLLLEMRVGYVLTFAQEGNSAEATGAALAPPILVLLVLLAFRGFGKAKTRRSKAIIACWVLGIMFFSLSARASQERQDRVLTDAERAGLAIDGDLILHRGLGFTLPYPHNGFKFNADVQGFLAKQLPNQQSMTAWGLTSTIRSGVVIVEVTKGFKITHESFERFTGGMRQSMDTGAAKLLLDSLRWDVMVDDYRLSVLSGTGVYIKTRCLAPNGSGRGGFIVCVMTLANDSTSLDFVRDGLRLVDRR
jgi:hypothetical protein